MRCNAVDRTFYDAINDTYGHDVGNVLLCNIASILRENLRNTDVISRLGGDEFSILFPETDYQSAEAIIKNVNSFLVEAMERNEWPIRFSIGAITFVKSLGTVRDMIKAIDDLMYKAKKSGKNNIIHIESTQLKFDRNKIQL